MTDLSPAAQTVIDAFNNAARPEPHHQREAIAAALRALTRTPLVDEAHMRGWIVSAITTEDLLDLVAELDPRNPR